MPCRGTSNRTHNVGRSVRKAPHVSTVGSWRTSRSLHGISPLSAPLSTSCLEIPDEGRQVQSLRAATTVPGRPCWSVGHSSADWAMSGRALAGCRVLRVPTMNLGVHKLIQSVRHRHPSRSTSPSGRSVSTGPPTASRRSGCRKPAQWPPVQTGTRRETCHNAMPTITMQRVPTQRLSVDATEIGEKSIQSIAERFRSPAFLPHFPSFCPPGSRHCAWSQSCWRRT